MREHPVSYERLVAEVLASQGIAQDDPYFDDIVEFLNTISYVLLMNWLMKLRVHAPNDAELVASLDEFGIGLLALLHQHLNSSLFQVAYTTLALAQVRNVILLGIHTVRFISLQAEDHQQPISDTVINTYLDYVVDHIFPAEHQVPETFIAQLTPQRFIDAPLQFVQAFTKDYSPPTNFPDDHLRRN